jgi:DNA-binding SARP family transcriptional activator/DNA-binding NarL/FixJ family response regulator
MRDARVKGASVPIASEVGAAASASGRRRRAVVSAFVVAESRLYREALAAALRAYNRIELLGTAADVPSAVVALPQLEVPPEVVLLDHAVAEGVAAVRAVQDAAPRTSVVALAVDGAEQDVLAWIEAGAAGYVSRDASLQHLLANVAAVAQGETLCSPRLAAVLADRVAALASERRGPPPGMAERLHIAAAGTERRRPDELGIRLLGSLGIDRGGVRLPALPTQRSEALFAYLVLHRDRLIHRDVLCGKFWSEQSDAQARKSLRTTLWRIRSVIEADPADRGTLLRVEGESIGFAAPSPVWVDVWELEDSVRMCEQSGGELDEPTARRLGQVAELYRGDFMEGHYDDWCSQPRDRLRTAFLTALERLAKHRGRNGDWLGAIACGLEILRHDPLREHVHRALMACHHAMGDRPSALRQYQECSLVLRDQLGIEPMEETRTLYERIRGTA